MNSLLKRNNSTLIVLYSTFLIIVFEILLSRISPQIYSVFNLLPILLLGLIIKYKELLLSLIISFFLLISMHTLSPEIMQKPFIVIHFIISLITLLFFGSFNLAKKINLDLSNLIAIKILFFLIIFTFFYIFFINNLEQEALRTLLKKTIEEIIINYGIQKNKEIAGLIETLMLVIPSINSLIFFITLSLNLVLANFLVKKMNIAYSKLAEFETFSTPLWFSFIYVILVILSFILKPTSTFFVFVINAIICMSFCYLLEGYNSFNSYLKNTKINVYLKFVIIFLLFIFLGYVLLLMLLFIGFYKNILKKIKRD